MTDRFLQSCPLGCRADITLTLIELPEGNLRRCSQCGQLISACTPERYAQSMQEFNAPEGTMTSGKALERQKKRIGRILMQGIHHLSSSHDTVSMLDVGCSSGSVLKVGDSLGLKVHGVEPAPRAAVTARNLGFEVFTGFLHDAKYPNHAFDIVTLFEVIEHLREPLVLAHEINRILKPGGIWLIGTGNVDSWTAHFMGARWEYFDINKHGGHVSFFNPQSISLLAQRSGFEMVEIITKRVSMANREDTSPWAYNISRIARELCEVPARLLHKGHDMLAIFRKSCDV
ncbi:MAG: hypothetical protein BMS9Abin18_1456 [Zetaproteobacteria bacterium]|nr:MAG: hypothetical protein BMS9Abin18_1456 [Zetaproteobacteria bacterium]